MDYLLLFATFTVPFYILFLIEVVDEEGNSKRSGVNICHSHRPIFPTFMTILFTSVPIFTYLVILLLSNKLVHHLDRVLLMFSALFMVMFASTLIVLTHDVSYFIVSYIVCAAVLGVSDRGKEWRDPQNKNRVIATITLLLIYLGFTSRMVLDSVTPFPLTNPKTFTIWSLRSNLTNNLVKECIQNPLWRSEQLLDESTPDAMKQPLIFQSKNVTHFLLVMTMTYFLTKNVFIENIT